MRLCHAVCPRLSLASPTKLFSVITPHLRICARLQPCLNKLHSGNLTLHKNMSIRSLFESAERQRKEIEASWETNTATYQQNLAAAISTYEECLLLADRLSLFSSNETLEDLTSSDLQYLRVQGRCFWMYC
jgi:hypothetical protein